MTELLTPRECEIIGLLARGYSLDEAGEALGLNHGAMAVYRCRIQRKIGMPDVTGIRLWASPITDTELRRLTGQARAQVEELAA